MLQLHISGISAAGRELKLAQARIAAGHDTRCTQAPITPPMVNVHAGTLF
jgi:hypothetical protein